MVHLALDAQGGNIAMESAGTGQHRGSPANQQAVSIRCVRPGSRNTHHIQTRWTNWTSHNLQHLHENYDSQQNGNKKKKVPHVFSPHLHKGVDQKSRQDDQAGGMGKHLHPKQKPLDAGT